MYVVLRAFVYLALHLYCGRIRVNINSAPALGQPLLLACNHPNSFLDALLVATHLPHRMRFLARGDAFRDPRAASVLGALFMIPIYRMSEGRTELKRTGESFIQAQHQLDQGNSLLVFSEGIALNEAGLRPLGKATARIAYRAWQGGLDLQVLPVWLEYGNFHRPFMDVSITTGKAFGSPNINAESEATFLRRFNGTLHRRLLEIPERNQVQQTTQPTGRDRIDRAAVKSLLFLPALVGLLLHAPWYFPLRGFLAYRTQGTVFFDSVLFALLFLTYPLWLLVLLGVGTLLSLKAWAVAVLIIAPLSALALRKFKLA